MYVHVKSANLMRPKYQGLGGVRKRVIRIRDLCIPHVDHTANAIAMLHGVKRLVDILQRFSVCDELIDLELALHVIIDQARELGAALDSTERTSSPDTACDKLECYDLVRDIILRLRELTYAVLRSPVQPQLLQ